MKNIILSILALTVIAGSYLAYSTQKKTKIEMTSAEYYQRLAKECGSKASKNCCLSSLE